MATTSPGMPIPYLLEITNIGNATAISATATISFPDGSTSSMLITNLAPGATINGTLQWPLGQVSQSASTTEQVPILTLAAAAPATVRPGELVTIDLTIQNVGSGASGPLEVWVVNPDGITTGATAPANVLSIQSARIIAVIPFCWARASPVRSGRGSPRVSAVVTII